MFGAVDDEISTPRTTKAPQQAQEGPNRKSARRRARPRSVRSQLLRGGDSLSIRYRKESPCCDANLHGWTATVRSGVAGRSFRSNRTGPRAFRSTLAANRRAPPAWASAQAGGLSASDPVLALPLPAWSARNGPRLRRSPYPGREAFQVSGPRSCSQHLPRHGAFDLG